MSDRDHEPPRCMVCGNLFFDFRKGPLISAWLRRYRLLYRDKTADWCRISGVGLFDPTTPIQWIVPIRQSKYWYEIAHQPDSKIRVGAWDRRSVNSHYGYPFHEACWSLLVTMYIPDPVPLKAILRVCRKLPKPHSGDSIVWGQHFGSLLSKGESRNPADNDRDWLVNKFDDWVWRNPSDMETISSFLKFKDTCPKDKTTLSTRPPTSDDPFTRLPMELCLEIAGHLPTSAFFKLRHASRVFASVFHMQLFWRPKFAPGGEREWVTTLMASLGILRNLKNAYHTSSNIEFASSGRNRLSILSLLQKIRKPLRFTDPESDNIVTRQTSTGPGSPLSDVTDASQEAPVKIIVVPSPLSFVRLSYVEDGEHGEHIYLCGLTFVSKEGKEVKLGHPSSDDLEVLIATLTDLIAAVRGWGIRGIMCHPELHFYLPWVECYNCREKTEPDSRSNDEAIKILEAVFLC